MSENSPSMEDIRETNDSGSACGAKRYAEKLALKILKLYLLFLAFTIAATIIAPPDVATQITLAVMMAIVYGLTTLAVSRFKLLKNTAPLTKTAFIFVFSVALTLLVLYTSTLWVRCRSQSSAPAGGFRSCPDSVRPPLRRSVVSWALIQVILHGPPSILTLTV